MPDFSSAIALLRKPIEDLYSLATGAVKTKISALRAASRIKNLHKKLYESQRVKTIWNTDRPLSLASFFHPVLITTMGEGAPRKARLSSLDDLPENFYVIYGTVGQGKSILLRYLLGKEIKSGVRIPVLCELRNISNQHLDDDLCTKFCSLLGIEKDPELFDVFARNGKISFLLDGFDEIEPANVQKVTQQIEDLSYKYESCRIAVTSRPESECRHLTKFSSVKICPLDDADLEPFYKRITRDEDFTKRLIAAIRTSPLKIRGLVITPLLATLLAISYRAAHKIPLDFAEFYDELFQILLVRHDGAKLGWRRLRKTKLNDREIQQVFEAFCFATRKRQIAAVEREAAYDIAKECVTECQLTADPQQFLDDIRKITCLLVDEGKKISFVHLSVQEFFAARYVKTRPETAAKAFYTQLRTGKWQNWQEELLFLRQIDSHRATKYFTIGDLDETLGDLLGPDRNFNADTLPRYLNGLQVEKSIVKRDGKDVASYLVTRTPRAANTMHYRNLDSTAFTILFSTDYVGAANWVSGFTARPDCNKRTYADIASDRGMEVVQALNTGIVNAVEQMIAETSFLKKNIDHAEVPRSFIDIS